VFAAELDGRFYLHTGRPTLEFAKGTDEKGFVEWLDANNVRYAAIFPTDFVMRTIREKSVHNPLAAETVRAWLHTAGFERVFSDPDENSEIYLRGR
jgi:hypothetical protein